MATDPVFPVIHHASEEVIRTPDYRYDNATRGGAAVHVVQQTLAGEAYHESEGAPRLAAGPGRAMLFRHGEPGVYGYPESAHAPYRLRYVSFYAGAAAPLFMRIRADFGTVVDMRPDAESAALLGELVRRFAGRGFTDRLQESDLLFRMLVALYREQVAETCGRDPAEFGKHFIHNHYRSPLNLKEIAGRCGVSREHFIRAFSRRYGESPGALLRRLRLDHARSLVVASRIGLAEVARASGFVSANSLCRAYRHAFGVTPGVERPAL